MWNDREGASLSRRARQPGGTDGGDRREFLKKLSYIAPAIITYSLRGMAQAGSYTKGTPPDPPRPSLMTREGKPIIRR
jgi:hypothetical protein